MSPQEERFYYLAERSLDEQLSSEEQSELDQLLNADQDLKELYFQLRHQHAQLALNPKVSGPTLLQTSDVHQLDLSETKPVKTSIIWKAVALIACALALWSFIQAPSETNSIAMIEQTDACIWEGGSLPTLVGSELEAGTLKLKQGHARIKFNSGALLKIEGPVTLELIDTMNCTLHQGTLVAEVPPSAHLFKINTPKAEVIDLGTSFSLNVDPTGDSIVHVLNGEVKAKARNSNTTHHLTAGQGSEITDLNQVKVIDNMQSEWDFLKRKHLIKPKTHSVKVRTDRGLGDDSYVYSMWHENVSDTVLLVKNGDGAASRFMRHAFVKFDLQALPKEELLDATLQLQFVHTGFGVGVDLPDSDFKVYALTDQTFDQWNYPTLKWENAPAHLKHTLKGDLVKEVASFTVPRGKENDLYEIKSSKLVDLIKSDSNQIINLIIVRETEGNHSSTDTLVHGIASKRHPTAQAPTLKLDFKPPHQI